jgi:chromosome segregation ATPase
VDTLVRERDVAVQQLEVLGADRDRLAMLLEHAEAAGRGAAHHEAEVQRLGRTIEQQRDQLTAMTRRNEELAERARGLEAELSRLQRDREDERGQARRSQEALRRDVASAQAEASAATDRAAEAATTRAELEGRLADLEDRLRAANDQCQRLEVELKARRDHEAVPQPATEPGRSEAAGDHGVYRLGIDQLTADLDEARAANERLRSLLNVFGLVDHLGSGPDLPPGRATTPVALPGGQPLRAPAPGSGPP